MLVTALVSLSVFAAPAGAPARATQCQPVRAVFYTENDWWQLGPGLAQDASPCVQYYISIEPLLSDKTVMQQGVAGLVDELGPNFHAVAEVNYTAWANWVATTGESWYQAGQQARANMDAAGFNVAVGDTWDVNEFPSEVLTNTDGARQDVEQLVQGLYAGDGSEPPAKGIVFMVGVGQTGTSLPQYKADLESWYQDGTFWQTMSLCVSDFMFESYGDVRAYAVAGEDGATRIENLNAFLQAPLELASAPNTPSTEAAAKAFLGSAYGPLANASWAWSNDYGWTRVSAAAMADFVAAQTDAMRAYGAGSRIGFAWNPLNSEGLSLDHFDADSAAILSQLAASIQQSDEADAAQACAPARCSAVVHGAAPATGWSSFSAWTPTAAAFTSPPLAVRPRARSGPLAVELETGGVWTTLPNVSSVLVTSTSPSGMFAPSPSGPWTPTLTLTIPAGTSMATFYYLDAVAGSPTLHTDLDGQVSTQTETIAASVPLEVPSSPAVP